MGCGASSLPPDANCYSPSTKSCYTESYSPSTKSSGAHDSPGRSLAEPLTGTQEPEPPDASEPLTRDDPTEIKDIAEDDATGAPEQRPPILKAELRRKSMSVLEHTGLMPFEAEALIDVMSVSEMVNTIARISTSAAPHEAIEPSGDEQQETEEPAEAAQPVEAAQQAVQPQPVQPVKEAWLETELQARVAALTELDQAWEEEAVYFSRLVSADSSFLRAQSGDGAAMLARAGSTQQPADPADRGADGAAAPGSGGDDAAPATMMGRRAKSTLVLRAWDEESTQGGATEAAANVTGDAAHAEVGATQATVVEVTEEAMGAQAAEDATAAREDAVAVDATTEGEAATDDVRTHETRDSVGGVAAVAARARYDAFFGSLSAAAQELLTDLYGLGILKPEDDIDRQARFVRAISTTPAGPTSPVTPTGETEKSARGASRPASEHVTRTSVTKRAAADKARRERLARKRA